MDFKLNFRKKIIFMSYHQKTFRKGKFFMIHKAIRLFYVIAET